MQHISLFNNATIALITALQALRITGEVITTPYSFVATSHAILWNGLTPVFVDIENDGYNIDYRKIEQAITPKLQQFYLSIATQHPVKSKKFKNS